ncbi:alpha/beta hydrolase [Streptomyces sp. NPDC004609]|uniref:alpha/beta hydrolase n=1 Tax=Streptomyces sp. NPDC004609 TaxID=3364704 RepID=UPI0036A74CA4
MTAGTLTWQQLRDLKRSGFEDAGDAWNEVSARSGADRERTNRAMSAKLRSTQESRSAEAALGRLRRLSRNYQYLQTECGLVRTALNGLASDLAEPQRQLRLALEEAAALNFTVQPDGSVSYPPATYCAPGGEKQSPGGTARGSARSPLEPPGFGELGTAGSGVLPGAGAVKVPNPSAERAKDISDRIARAVRSATEIDARYTRTLNRLKAAKGLDVTEATWKDVRQDTVDVRADTYRYLAAGVPEDKSPAARREWWDSLGDEQRQEYLKIAPDLIGYLDGIPALARDEANRNFLPVLIAELSVPGASDADRTQLEGLRAIEEKLRKPSQPPMYLLGIGTEGNGRAIIAYGNPDTSRNVSAYVPGLNTQLDGEFAGGTMRRAQDTALGAQGYDGSSASIVWLGYDAPQSADVASTGDASRGAPAYNSFMAGLEATNENRDPHLTAIGHSYGSLTVGTAARQEGGIPGVDDIILVGSPGVGVDRAEDLGVGKERVFVGSADNDLVTKVPTKAEVAFSPALSVTGVFVNSGDINLSGDDNYFGKDPASEAFGAQRFKVGDGPNPVLDGEIIAAHSQYFTPEKDRESADNIARIVSGEYGIKREEYR